LYSVNGQLLSNLVDKEEDAGNYSIQIEKAVGISRVFLIVLKAGSYHQKKVVFLIK
jgi:hypothetical protein